MTAPPPHVSVLITIYDGMPWLPIALESVFAQTFRDFELLLVDDGSTDGSGAACDALAAQDGRVRVLRHAGGANRGQVASLNRGLAEARGKYVARLDADDMMYPERLAMQVACLDAHPEVVLVGSQVDWAGTTGTTRWATPTDPHVACWTLLLENCFMHGGVTFRTDAVRALGGYDDAYATAEDYDLWLRIAEHHDIVNLPAALAWFNHLRSDNLSTVHADRQDDAACRLMRRAIDRVLPEATDEQINDLYFIGRGHVWPDSPVGAERRGRLASAARMLGCLHRAFLRSRAVPDAAQGIIHADCDRRLMRIRLALAEGGGVGHIARLYRPRWASTVRFLELPALFTRL